MPVQQLVELVITDQGFERTYFLVFASKQTVKHSPFKIQPLPDPKILALIDNLLRRLDRYPTHPRNLLRRTNSPVQALLRRLKNLRRKPPLAGLPATEIVPGEYQLHSPGLANRARQPLGAAGAGDDAELDLGLAERGGGRAVHDVGHHGELAAAAEGVAVDGGDDGLLDARAHVGPEFDEVGPVGVREGLVFHLFDVGPGC